MTRILGPAVCSDLGQLPIDQAQKLLRRIPFLKIQYRVPGEYEAKLEGARRILDLLVKADAEKKALSGKNGNQA